MKIALITGASRGLGRSMAKHLGSQGTDILLTYRERKDDADSLIKDLEALGRKAVAIQLDTGISDSFDSFVDTVRAALDSGWKRETFDILINNAGVGRHAAFKDTTEAQFDELMNIHLKGPFFLTQKLLPVLADGGRIINLSSGLTRLTYPGYAAYAAMKGGVEVMTRYLAKELGPRKITVNVLAPGAIETDFGGGAVRDNSDLNSMIASQTALGRVGLPDDIGGAVAMLVSEDAGWINGQRIEASGGQGL